MVDDDELREKLAKVEALFRRAGSPGERATAGAAMDRLHGRLHGRNREEGPETELQFLLPDLWSVRLFVAVCRKHGLRPFRYARQRRTTVMVRARERQFDRDVWAECQTAFNIDPRLEWAPGVGQFQAADLTGLRGCSSSKRLGLR